MILYTPLAESDIFPYNGAVQDTHQCVNCQGRQMYVKELNNGSYQLIRLLSTDPQDFLNEMYAPGTILR